MHTMLMCVSPTQSRRLRLAAAGNATPMPVTNQSTYVLFTPYSGCRCLVHTCPMPWCRPMAYVQVPIVRESPTSCPPLFLFFAILSVMVLHMGYFPSPLTVSCFMLVGSRCRRRFDLLVPRLKMGPSADTRYDEKGRGRGRETSRGGSSTGTKTTSGDVSIEMSSAGYCT